jgi:hypothetical protein
MSALLDCDAAPIEGDESVHHPGDIQLLDDLARPLAYDCTKVRPGESVLQAGGYSRREHLVQLNYDF